MGIRVKVRSDALYIGQKKKKAFVNSEQSIWDSILTLPSPALCFIVRNLPASFVVHLDDEHDGQIATTRRRALLGTGSQEGRGTTS